MWKRLKDKTTLKKREREELGIGKWQQDQETKEINIFTTSLKKGISNYSLYRKNLCVYVCFKEKIPCKGSGFSLKDKGR